MDAVFGPNNRFKIGQKFTYSSRKKSKMKIDGNCENFYPLNRPCRLPGPGSHCDPPQWWLDPPHWNFLFSSLCSWIMFAPVSSHGTRLIGLATRRLKGATGSAPKTIWKCSKVCIMSKNDQTHIQASQQMSRWSAALAFAFRTPSNLTNGLCTLSWRHTLVH